MFFSCGFTDTISLGLLLLNSDAHPLSPWQEHLPLFSYQSFSLCPLSILFFLSPSVISSTTTGAQVNAQIYPSSTQVCSVLAADLMSPLHIWKAPQVQLVLTKYTSFPRFLPNNQRYCCRMLEKLNDDSFCSLSTYSPSLMWCLYFENSPWNGLLLSIQPHLV